MNTTVRDVAVFLEEKAKLDKPITYGDVIRRFPDLPPLTAYWKSHPLCSIFGELDGEDQMKKRPFRTALVYAQETGKPGQGFFDTVQSLRGITILKGDQDKVWIAELAALRSYYL